MAQLNAKQALSYKILFHMLGIPGNKSTHGAFDSGLKRGPRPFSALADSLKEYCSALHNDKQSHLADIANCCTSIVAPASDTGLVPLYLEAMAGPEGRHGLSRNPFRPVESDEITDDIALGVACYLLRGYCSFFQRPRHRRNFNAAKVALNDFHQAYQLSWRLYHAWDCSHHRSPERLLPDYYREVLKVSFSDGGNVSPGASPYYIWNMLLLCEIMRGNIYRQLDYTEEADRHYRHAQGRFDQLCRFAHQDNKNVFSRRYAPWFLTRTLIIALYQRSKARFDMGQFLESLVTQTQCLQYLICLHGSEHRKIADKCTILSTKLDNILIFLETQRVLPIFDRYLILHHFGDPDPVIHKQLELKPAPWLADLRAFCHCIPPDMASFVAQVMARIGFTLYTLRPKPAKHSPIKNRWMNAYFRFDKTWIKTMKKEISKSSNGRLKAVVESALNQIVPSHLGFYCETFYTSGRDKRSDGQNPDMKRDIRHVFVDDVERKFALMLRQEFGRGNNDNPLDFYENIFGATTENISNMVTIPRRNCGIIMRRGYKYRRSEGDMSRSGMASLRNLNKLVVLRRWQSFNPKIPRPSGQRLLGGGYFLLWQGKGIVIDPGYDFVQNFYDEGFSLEDIDAVIITHSHPDHDDDFATLMTLVKEWNEYYYSIGQAHLVKRLDIFLNESAHKKFSSWLQVTKVKIGRVIPLPLVCWDKESTDPLKGPVRGRNAFIDLRQPDPGPDKNAPIYNLRLEVVPAWHDDIIGKTAAVGLKFHLYRGNAPAGVIGITGDTGAYGLGTPARTRICSILHINRHYRKCDILIGHLGDIRLRELASLMEIERHDGSSGNVLETLVPLLREWFSGTANRKQDSRAFPERVRDFFRFLIALNLIPEEALKLKIQPTQQDDNLRVQEWLGRYLEVRNPEGKSRYGEQDIIKFEFDPTMPERITLASLYYTLHDSLGRAGLPIGRNVNRSIISSLNSLDQDIDRLLRGDHDRHDIRAYLLLGFLVHCARIPWKYPFHLGVLGIYGLFTEMYNVWAKTKQHGKLFIIGELPEELSSHRQQIADLMNISKSVNRLTRRPVKAFTGDVGLHVSLDDPARPRLRCAFCNYNNELAYKKKTYHTADHMLEVSIKRDGGAMIYLCDQHYPGSPNYPRYFLNRPYLRII